MKFSFKFKRISTRLTVIIAGVSVVCSIILSLTIGLYTIEQKESEHESMLNREVVNISSEVAEVIASRQGQVEALATMDIFPIEDGVLISNLDTLSPAIEPLRKMAEADPDVARYVVMDAQGLGMTTQNNAVNLAERNYFKQSITGTSAFPEFLASQTTGKLTIMYSAPIKDESGETVGVLVMGVDGSSLTNIAKNVTMGTDHPYIINKDGKVIAHDSEDYVKEGHNIHEDEDLIGISSVISDSQEVGFGKCEIAGDEKLLSYGNIAGTDWKIIIPISTSEANSSIYAITEVSLFVLLFIIAASIGIAFYFAERISRPIKVVAKALDSMAEGEISRQPIKEKDHDAVVNRPDEIGILGKSIVELSTKLYDVMTHIKGTVAKVADSSLKMKSQSRTVSEGASEQATATEEVSSTMEQMVANIQNSSSNAQRTAEIANQSVQSGQEGATSVEKSVNAMSTIREKISVVEQIAQQTNILALNASVEAARAGSAGSGFAVVAQEVRKLAELSSSAANEITLLTADGLQLANKSGQIISDLLPEIEQTGALVKEIVSASMEQETGSQQINIAVQRMDSVTQRNASAAEQLADMANELNGQAQTLKDDISFFRLEE